jgi:hypothetical protein
MSNGCALKRATCIADGWRAVLEPVVARYRRIVKRLYFRGDAAFANPEIYEYLEAEGTGYAIRLPVNRVLQDRIGYLLKCPVGRPPHEVRRSLPASDTGRRAGKSHGASWPKSSDSLASFTLASSSVADLARSAERIVAFDNQRGTAEQYIS